MKAHKLMEEIELELDKEEAAELLREMREAKNQSLD